LFHGLGNWEVKSCVETGLIQKLPYEVFIHRKNDLPVQFIHIGEKIPEVTDKWV
jgi:hypothetical protein